MGVEKTNSQKLVGAFFPVRIFLLITGQLPFSIHKRPDGTNEFQYHFCNGSTFMFGFTCIFNSLLYFMITIGFISVIVGFRFEEKAHKINATAPLMDGLKPWEEAMIANHLALVIVIYMFLTLVLVSSMYLLRNGKEYAHYWNYWIRVVQIMDVNPTKGVKLFVFFEILLHILIIVGECGLFYKLPGIRAVAGVYISMIFRFIFPGLPGYKIFSIAQLCGFVIIAYAHLGSRAIIIQFVFFTKLLKNVATVYNTRLKHGLKLYLKREPRDAKAKRESFRLLLKDHLIIVHLIKLTDRVFGPVLKAYYMTQLLALLFEIFHIWKLVGPAGIQSEVEANYSAIFPKVFPHLPEHTKEETFEAELLTSETGVTCVLLLQTIASCFFITTFANDVHDEVMNGYKIIRQRHLISSRTKSERNFVYNLMVSYTTPNSTMISVGGFFNITKALFAGMILSVCGYFVMLIQFEFPRFTIPEEAYSMHWDYLAKLI